MYSKMHSLKNVRSLYHRALFPFPVTACCAADIIPEALWHVRTEARHVTLLVTRYMSLTRDLMATL